MLTKILPKIPLYNSFRGLGFPRMMPLNLTLGLTCRCNSRCRTCRIYEKEAEELTKEEWGKIFKSIGGSPYWFTLSGGEPFLRRDLAEICRSAYQTCSPGIINIPTNGLLVDKIPPLADKITQECKNTEVIINLSIDELNEKDDEIRGVPQAFVKALKTYHALKELKKSRKNLTLGIHTVISRFNVKRIPEIFNELIKLEPDSYITEIAEERVELGTIGTGITPSLQDYRQAIDFLVNQMKKLPLSGISKITRAFRLRYYEMVKKVLEENRQIYPCYAGFASAQISADGEVWFCCIKGESVGNLREAGYDFKKVWFSEKADILRKKVKMGECCCPLANASYTNMLLSVKTLAGVAGEVFLT